MLYELSYGVPACELEGASAGVSESERDVSWVAS